MTFRNCLTVMLCSFALLIATSVQAQEDKELKLSDAQTPAEVVAYLNQEMAKRARGTDTNAVHLASAEVLMSASDRMLEIAEDDQTRASAYNFQFLAFQNRIKANVEGAEQNLETFFQELASKESTKKLAWSFRFAHFSNNARTAEPSPKNYDRFMSELQPWVNSTDFSFTRIANLGLSIAERNKVPQERFVKRLSTFIQSADALSEAEKEKRMMVLEGMFRLTTVGNDPKLYGKTLDDKDFEWEKLRGKYVLIKFTATWCGPCQMQIPGMLEFYEKYRDKGFEIISVYMWQREDDPVMTVKEYVEEKKLPWIILSEELSKRAKHPEFGEFYGIAGVPTFVLVDKEGKMMIPITHGDDWKAKLRTIF